MDTNLTWAEEDVNLWKGWTYSPEKNRYYFNDIGNESLAAFWADEFLNQAYEWRYCWPSHLNGRDRYRDAVAFRGAWGNEAKDLGKDRRN